MSETPVAFAKRRVAELQPLIDQCLPENRLHIEHFPVTSEEMEKMIEGMEAKAPAELRERVGDEKAARLEMGFRLIAELKMTEKVDSERLIKLLMLGSELQHRGYTVAWEDIDPHDATELSELDLKALNFERAAVPSEGTFLIISFDAEA
jgi:hypothetical protein